MRRISLAVLSTLIILAASPGLAQSVEAYGEDWYRAPFWSGEYPNGFTVLEDAVLKLRPALDPRAEKTIDCPVSAKATYQQWNGLRVQEDALSFVSFTEIDEMAITTAYDATLYRHDDATEVAVSFKPGDKWRYLAYFGEGAFLMEYDGVQYDGDQDLFDHSESVKPGERGYEEWLRINCSNNRWGWLFMGDIAKDDITFAGPNILGYGEAADAQ